jgi:tetratricopeptide (TPR) repeat protein
VEAAGQLDDPVLLVRALEAEASALQLMGDDAAALARYTRILGLAEDPASSGRLDHPLAAEAVADAYWSWVACARFVTGIPVQELYRVLDAAERWLAATGHRDWRAGILNERALTHRRLGKLDAAVAAAEEALALKIQYPDAPGYTLNGLRYQLGDILREAGRAAEAAPHYQAVLADPAATPWGRRVAHQGLAWCALAAGDPAAARREAHTAVLLAEPLGDDALCNSLHVLAEACRADGDLDAAWQAATRYLEAAARIGGHNRPYYAARTAVDIALDRSDLAAARRLLGELDEHAVALDATTGNTTRTGDTARRHQRLADLEKASP